MPHAVPSRRVPHTPLLVALLALLAATGCAATREESTPPAPAPAGEVTILALKEESAYDASLVKLVGTIVNRSSEPATRVSVRVEGRDATGRALTRILVEASPETIAPGATATFAADVPRSTAVHDYHAEIVGR